ncbi:MAG TPA: bifunctional tetrahydrofolate synthase/dihydrofolate synthase [Gammaproteobacteria bacterium]
MSSRFSTMHQWLQWQETLHPVTIDLGLDRVSRVYAQMGSVPLAPVVVIVSGTNGKGSCVALLEQIALYAGYSTGAYTSPHILSYNERVRINGKAVSDADFIAAFAAVDAARGTESLTYFEFGTLAAFHIFTQRKRDFVVLEVGMGGRLDATNIIDADAALITSIGLDHVQWLGHTRDEIAREKAGVLRSGRPAVCGDPQPPAILLEIARNQQTELRCIDRDFSYQLGQGSWDWKGPDAQFHGLPLPRMQGAAQLRNAASVLMLLSQLAPRLPVGRAAIEQGLQACMLPGRQQIVAQNPQILIDVAHNAEAIAELVLRLEQEPRRRTCAVFSMLRDKPVAEAVRQLKPHIDAWYLAPVPTDRTLSAAELARIVATETGIGSPRCFDSVTAAFDAARHDARTEERILVIGSFWTAAEVLACCRAEGL